MWSSSAGVSQSQVTGSRRQNKGAANLRQNSLNCAPGLGVGRRSSKTPCWGFFRCDISVMYQQRKFCLQNPVSKTLLRMYVYNCLKKHRVTDTDANLVGHMEHLHLPFSFFLATAGTDLVCEILLAGVLIKTEISVRI